MSSVTHIHNMSRNQHLTIGDEVQDKTVRFFIGAINDSHELCSIDKSKPWTLLDERDPMAACIRQGNYAVTASKLTLIAPAVKGGV